MNDILDGPVIGYRRWKVNADGWLEGYGVPIPWQAGVQTAECHGQQTISVAEYCDPPTPKKKDTGSWASMYHFEDTMGWGTRPLQLPDGRWVKKVTRKSCNDPTLLPIDHPVPSLHSQCGIWAHKQPIPDCDCPEPEDPRHGAVGVVRMWGRGVEHDDGWRAEHAELVALVDHSNRVRRDYWVPRYRTTAEMYAEWAPGHDGWAARHDPCWCDHGRWLPLGFHAGGVVYGPSGVNYGPTATQVLPSGAISPAMLQSLLGTGGLVSYHEPEDTEDIDPKAKALRDKQVRNANHPGQDRPERSRRKRKGWRR